MKEQIKCPECGNINEFANDICSNCGFPFDEIKERELELQIKDAEEKALQAEQEAKKAEERAKIAEREVLAKQKEIERERKRQENERRLKEAQKKLEEANKRTENATKKIEEFKSEKLDTDSEKEKCDVQNEEISDQEASQIEFDSASENIVHKKSKKSKRIILLIAILISALCVLAVLIQPTCEHEYDSGVVVQEATCTEEGSKVLTCTKCEKEKTEKIPVKEHEYVESITKEATFEEEGVRTFTCKNCGNTYTEPIPIREDKIVFTVIGKNDYPEDTDAWRFSPFVELVCHVENMTDKDIQGVQGVLKISDLFNVEIMSMNWDVTGETIPAHGSITQTEYGLEVNRFMEEHTKVYNTSYSDLKFEYTVSQIIYTDGTTEIIDAD